MKATNRLLCLAAFAMSAIAVADEQQTIEQARRSFDEDELVQLQELLSAQSEKHPDDFDIVWGAAEIHRIRADWRLTRRTIGDREGDDNKLMKREQMELAEAGIPYAEKAIEVARTTEQEVAAHRTLGELYSFLISGPVSGMRNGPKAKSHIELALELDAGDPEPMRARGLMYLHNPPFTGGDVDKAIEVFSRCGELNPDTEIYDVQLALAFRKAKRLDEARDAAQRALEKNPDNANAKALLDVLADE